VPRARERLLLLGIVGQYPVAGVAWQAIHYLLGLAQLGWDVFYVEDSGATPYDPRAGTRTEDCSYAVGYVADVMRRIGLAERWAYVDLSRGEVYGTTRARLDALYREATAIVNLCGATAPRAEHRQGARLLYLETDPVYEQIRIAQGDTASLAFLASHDVLFTYGENLGAADCPIPLERFAWRTTRPPVVLDAWEVRTDPAAPCFTSIASWQNRGKDVSFRGETYQWSKHVNFLRFLDLPRRTPQRFQLAMDPLDPEAEARVRGEGWELVDPRPISSDIDVYRDFCYLAAGKPVVTQDTGFTKYIPTGEGLFAFSTHEEVVQALDRINADYRAQSAAARRVAAEAFGATPVLRRLLADAGLG
jgi:hypothetical protein